MYGSADQLLPQRCCVEIVHRAHAPRGVLIELADRV
jgi:hypothetical protein